MQTSEETTTDSFRAKALRVRNMLVGAHAVHHALAMGLPTLLIFIKEDLGFSYTQLGFIAAAVSITGGVLQYPAGLLADRFDSKHVLVAGYTLTLTGLFLLSSSTTYLGMLLSQVVVGLGNATFHPASFPRVADATKHTGLGMGMAMHNIGGIVGTAASYSLVAVLASRFGWRMAIKSMVMVGALLAAYFAFAYSELPTTEDESEEETEEGEGYQVTGSGLQQWVPILVVSLASFFAGAFGRGFMNFLPTFLSSVKGATAVAAGMLSTIMLASGAFGSFTGGKLADRMDRSTIIVAAVCIATVLILLLIHLPIAGFVLVALIIGIGFLRSMTRPPFHAITTRFSPSGQSGTSFGLVFAGSALGGALGSPVVGYISDLFNLSVAFTVMVVIYLLHAVLVRWLGLQMKSKVVPQGEEEKEQVRA